MIIRPGGNRRAAYSKCNPNCEQKSASFDLKFFHNLSGYDCQMICKKTLSQASKQRKSEPQFNSPSMQKYVSVEMRFVKTQSSK